MRFASLAFPILLAAAPVAAQPLTIPAGETWAFSIDKGQPANARKVDSKAEPKRGEITVTILTIMGTTMTARSNNPDAYTFKAELVGANGNAVPARTCTLPAHQRPMLESWPQKARAVRVSDFRPAVDPGAC